MYTKNNVQLRSINLISNSFISNDYSNTDISYSENSNSTGQNFKIDTLNNSAEFSSDIENNFVPISILMNNSSLEAIVVYMKDILDMRYIQISRALNRDQRTIWATYSKAKKKISNIINNSYSSNTSNVYFRELKIPVSIFISRNYSVLESIVLYLRENHSLSFNEISEILGKNYRTIWTVYRRAILKVNKKI